MPKTKPEEVSGCWLWLIGCWGPRGLMLFEFDCGY